MYVPTLDAFKHLHFARQQQVFNDESHHLNLYGSNVEVDYRGYEVTVENFIRVLTGRLGQGVEVFYVLRCSSS